MDDTGAPIHCQACENRPGRCVKLFGSRIKLNSATDDFVVFGYFQCLGRFIPVLILTIVLLMLQDRKHVKRDDEENIATSGIYLPSAVLSLIVVSSILFLETFGYEVIICICLFPTNI